MRCDLLSQYVGRLCGEIFGPDSTIGTGIGVGMYTVKKGSRFTRPHGRDVTYQIPTGPE
jgi:hypothetical protein